MIKTSRNRVKTEQAWNRLYTRLKEDNLLAEVNSEPVRFKRIWTWGTIVAAILVGIVVWASIDWIIPMDQRANDTMMLAQENQEMSNLVTTLEDGSVVFLAKQTTLKYPEHFASDKRIVNLQGDAFFDIAKKQMQTFTIETDKAWIEVLGTAFDVRSSGKELFSLSVVRGKVKVSLKQGGQSVFVNAGEVVTLKDTRLQVGKSVNNAAFNRYMKDIRFKDELLENVLKVVNMNTPALQIRTNSAELGKRRLTVAFSNNSPELVAELICIALNLKYIRQGNLLMISE